MLSTFLIRMLSCFNLLIDRAMAMEIASGRPSGTATIKRTIAVIPMSAASLKVSLENNPYLIAMIFMSVKIA